MTQQHSDVVEREVYVAARPETIFPFFTDPAKITLWKGIHATIDPQPGGIYRVALNRRDVVRGEYVEITPHSRVVFTWGWEGHGSAVPPGASTVEITLTPEGAGTRVRLRHLDLPADQRVTHGEGWDHYLPRMAARAEGRDPGPDPWAGPAPGA